MFNIIILAFFLFIALLSLIWTPMDASLMHIEAKFSNPNSLFWLGSDQYGRDLLSQLMIGARITLFISFCAIALSLLIGVPLGLLAASKLWGLDDYIMRLNDFSFAFPSLLTAILLTAIYGAGSLNIILSIAFFTFPVFSRMTRANALVIWQQDYVMAARMSGLNSYQITLKHVLPNIASVLLTQISIQFSMAILIESGLSYMGLGPPPPLVSWGRMLAESQTYLFQSPNMAILSGFCIFVSMTCFYNLGEIMQRKLNLHS